MVLMRRSEVIVGFVRVVIGCGPLVVWDFWNWSFCVGFTMLCNWIFANRLKPWRTFYGLWDFWFDRYICHCIFTTKKLSYPSVFFPALLKTAVIDKHISALFEIASIGNAITVTQDRRFTNHWNRRPIAAVFKNTGIGSSIALE